MLFLSVVNTFSAVIPFFLIEPTPHGSIFSFLF
jgi:hypothetical protein